jgi:hypothetical protein
MPWKKNKKLAAQGLKNLAYLPKDPTGWDATLAALAFDARRKITGDEPDLNAWAARHGLPGSKRYVELGGRAAVLWHGTSRARAEKIAEHGLFSKGGLWTTKRPSIAHGFTRGRSERFATEGAMVCLVLDRTQFELGHDYSVEGPDDDIIRFHRGLPAELVEYVLMHEAVCFAGSDPIHASDAWPKGGFKKREGRWAPVQKAPVRYDDERSYSTVHEFVAICLDRLLEELGEIAAVEAFTAAYANIEPWDALEHDGVLDVLEERCAPTRHRGKMRTFRPKPTQK